MATFYYFVRDYKNKNFGLVDEKAWEIFNKIDFDFSKFNLSFTGWGDVTWGSRHWNLDQEIKKFLEKHPRATIIELGAGFNTTFFRNDNGKIRFYDNDLPELIEIKRKLIPETDRYKYLAKSFFDDWYEDVEDQGDGILIVTNCALFLHPEKDIKKLFTFLAERFPDSDFIFDIHSKQDIATWNSILTGIGSVIREKWAIKRVKELEKWDSRIEIIDQYPLYSKIQRRKEWDNMYTNYKVGDKKITINRAMDIVDNTKNAQIVHIHFKK